MIEAGVPAIMSAHVIFAALDESLPATLSKPVLTDLLRTQLGFQGLVVTDFMDMKAISDNYGAGEAAVLSIAAGADLLLLGPNPERQREVYAALEKALQSGRLSETRVREAIAHSQAVANTYQGNWDTLPDYAAHQALAQDVASKAATLLLNDGVLPLKPKDKVLVLAPRLMQLGEPPLLGDVLATYHANVTSLRISPEPTDEELQKALLQAASADLIILGSYHWQDTFAASLIKLEEALVATGKPVVVIALGNPDDLRFFRSSPNAYLAVYSFWQANLDAASKVLVGQSLPQGKLPMPVGTLPIGSSMNGF
jgi:beta-N-acetylhexosaminidase